MPQVQTRVEYSTDKIILTKTGGQWSTPYTSGKAGTEGLSGKVSSGIASNP